MLPAPTLLTAEELLALPDDGTDRWLLAGKLRPGPPSRKDRFHAAALANLAALLGNWLDTQPRPRGEVLARVGIIFGRGPDTVVDIDLAVLDAQVISALAEDTEFIEGVPTLAVEILGLGETIGYVNEKIDVYQSARVPHVWIADPRWKTVTVHRTDGDPELLNVHDDLSAEPHLPGFRVPVKSFFE